MAFSSVVGEDGDTSSLAQSLATPEYLNRTSRFVRDYLEKEIVKDYGEGIDWILLQTYFIPICYEDALSFYPKMEKPLDFYRKKDRSTAFNIVFKGTDIFKVSEAETIQYFTAEVVKCIGLLAVYVQKNRLDFDCDRLKTDLQAATARYIKDLPVV